MNTLYNLAAIAVLAYFVLDCLAVIAIAVVAYRRRRILRRVVDRLTDPYPCYQEDRVDSIGE